MTKRFPAVLLLAISTTLAQPPRKRVAVFDFDYATVQSGLAAIFGQNVDIGKGIADLIVDRLVNDGTYSVIERKAINKIMAEQNFSNSDRADPNSAAKLGKILGVDAIIIGSITQFGRDDKSVGLGAGAVGGVASRYGLGGVGKKQSKAVVAVNARLVSTDTAEILAVASGKGYRINPSYSNKLGVEVDLVAAWTFRPYAQIETGVSHYFRGDYIKQSLAASGSKDASYVYVQLTLNL